MPDSMVKVSDEVYGRISKHCKRRGVTIKTWLTRVADRAMRREDELAHVEEVAKSPGAPAWEKPAFWETKTR